MGGWGLGIGHILGDRKDDAKGGWEGTNATAVQVANVCEWNITRDMMSMYNIVY